MGNLGTDLRKIAELLSKTTKWPWKYTPPHTGKYGKRWRGMIGNEVGLGQICCIDKSVDALGVSGFRRCISFSP